MFNYYIFRNFYESFFKENSCIQCVCFALKIRIKSTADLLINSLLSLAEMWDKAGSTGHSIRLDSLVMVFQFSVICYLNKSITTVLPNETDIIWFGFMAYQPL